MPQFSYVTFAQAKSDLAGRLADPGEIFWGNAEKGLYITEALRTWNALTEQWNVNYPFTSSWAQIWYDLSKAAGSPRVRTLTDTYLYTLMEYHLLEPPTGGVWTGTSQFNIADLQGALQRRRDEMIQATGCNLRQLLPFIRATPNVRRTIFNDSTLEPRRARFRPDSGFGNPVTMTREDTMAWDNFEPSHLQTSGTPQSWSLITGPPLTMDVDVAPNVPGSYDVISLQSGFAFTPPNSTLLNVPDDWSWLAKWGALADLLNRDSEATDKPRAEYCLKRYMMGLEIMKASNWLIAATIAGIPVDTPSVREMDGYSPEWENTSSAWPSLITAGMDLCSPCPVPAVGKTQGVSVVLVANAPCPILDSDFVQVSKDVYDVILDYAQVLASFKEGGAEFKQTQNLEQNFFQLAAATNKRLSKLALFSDMIHLEGKRQDIQQPR